MRIEKLVAAGFRGFNSERTIDFHEELTLVSAPNSHGKTSITEALEFLFYGVAVHVQEVSTDGEATNCLGRWVAELFEVVQTVKGALKAIAA